LSLYSYVDYVGQILQPCRVLSKMLEQPERCLASSAFVTFLDRFYQLGNGVCFVDAFLKELATTAKLGKYRASPFDGLSIKPRISVWILFHRIPPVCFLVRRIFVAEDAEVGAERHIDIRS